MEDARVTQDEMFGEMLVADRQNESQWNGGITYGDFIRSLYAKSHPVQAGPHGLASSKSKTHDPKCSAAVSAWVRHQATAETHKQLAACRAAARTGGQAEKLRGAGQEAKAQHLEHRVASGEPLTKKERLAKAKELRAERAAKKRPEPTAATEAPDSGEGSDQSARPAPRVFKKPAPKSPEQVRARDAIEAALRAKERVNRAIHDYGMGSPDEISATRLYKTALAAIPSEAPKKESEVDDRHQKMFDEFKALGHEYRKNQWSNPQVAAKAHERAKELIAEGKKLGFDLTQGDPSKVSSGVETPKTEEQKNLEEGRRIGLEGSELEAYVRSKTGKGQIHDIVEKTKHHADKPKGSPGFFTNERSKTESLTGKVGVPREKDVPEDMRQGQKDIEEAKKAKVQNAREQVQAARKARGLDNPETRDRIALARKQERRAKRAGLIPKEEKTPEEKDVDERYAKMHAENQAKAAEKAKGDQDKAKATEEARARIRAQAQAEGRIPKQESSESKGSDIQRLHDAFDAEDKKNRGSNFVHLADLKSHFPEKSMAEFHALVNQARREHGFSADSHEGNRGEEETSEQKAARIREREGSKPLSFLSRRENPKAGESGESKPEHHKHVEEAKHHVIGKLLDTFVEHGGLSKDEAEKMKAEEKAKPTSEDQPSAARQRTAARISEGRKQKEVKAPRRNFAMPPSREERAAAMARLAEREKNSPEKPTPFPTDGPFARSESRGDRPKSIQSPFRPSSQKFSDDAEREAEGNRRQEEERAAWERRNPPKLTPEQEKARKAEGRKAGEEMRKRHEAEYAAEQAKKDEEFRRNEEKYHPKSAKQEPAGYDEHGRERAIVKAIQKVHGGEPVDDRGMMIERIAKESGLPHDEAWKTILEMADRGALDFDPLEDTEAELSKQYGAKTYQPHHLRGKHANVVRLVKPHKLNVPLDKPERSQYAMARESLQRFIA